MKKAGFSTISLILLLLALLAPGCGGKKHDCKTEGHEWVEGRSGEMRCKHCGIYQKEQNK
jgi:hypothetical protein